MRIIKRSLPLITLLLGIGSFLVVIHFGPGDHGRIRGDWWELGRDVSMALVVAAIVSYLFEHYQRTHESLEAIQRAFNASMAERLTPEVWDGVRTQILEKHLLRRDVILRFTLERHTGLPSNLAVMDLELAYSLYNLGDQTATFSLRHELDYQFWFPELKLPRFKKVVLEDETGSKEFEGEELGGICDRGIVTVPVSLQPKRRSSKRIRTHRLEVVQAPGSYNLYMTEYTQGLRIRIGDTPNDLGIEVKVRPEGQAQVLKKSSTDEWVCESLILPGQGIEIKFIDPRSPRH